MSWTYDPTNIFARILRGEIPNRTVMDTPHTLVFHDLHPQAPVHVLAIPKGAYVTLDHFAAEASAEELVDFHRTVAKVWAITNAGAHGMQEVPHYHLHILGGRVLGRLVEPG
jgi:histidine triad (HIT) family protein